MKQAVLLALVASASSSAFALDPMTVFAKAPRGATAPQTGLFVGRDRATNKTCSVRLLSVRRTAANPIRGVESIYKVWNIVTTMVAEYDAFPGKRFTLVSPQSVNYPGAYSWMQATAPVGGFFGPKGTLSLWQENGVLFSASYSPKARRAIDSGPECRNLVRKGN